MQSGIYLTSSSSLNLIIDQPFSNKTLNRISNDETKTLKEKLRNYRRFSLTLPESPEITSGSEYPHHLCV